MRNNVLGSIVLGLASLVSGCAYEREERIDPTPTDNRAQILLSQPRSWYEHLRAPFEGFYFDPVTEALRESGATATDVVENYRAIDFFFAIEDPRVRYLVVAGHGNWSGITFPDAINGEFCTLGEHSLRTYVEERGITPKELLIRHTCGSNRIIQDGEQQTPPTERIRESIGQLYSLTQEQLSEFNERLRTLTPATPHGDISAIGSATYHADIHYTKLRITIHSPALEERYLRQERTDALAEQEQYRQTQQPLLEQRTAAARTGNPRARQDLQFLQRLLRARTPLERELVAIENEVYTAKHSFYQPQREYIAFSPSLADEEIKRAYHDSWSITNRYLSISAHITRNNPAEEKTFENRVERYNTQAEERTRALLNTRLQELTTLRTELYPLIFGPKKPDEQTTTAHHGLVISAENNLEHLSIRIRPQSWGDEALLLAIDQFYDTLTPTTRQEKVQFGTSLVGKDLSRIRGWDEVVTPFAFIFDPVPPPLQTTVTLNIRPNEFTAYEDFLNAKERRRARQERFQNIDELLRKIETRKQNDNRR